MGDLIREHILARTPDAADWWLTAAVLTWQLLVYAMVTYAIVSVVRLAGRWYVNR
jgi:hypothetical protein